MGNLKRLLLSLTMVLMAVCAITLTACSDDDESSQLVGTWTKQIQWVDTNGLRDHSYTFKGNGTGTFKHWDWYDQKYHYQNFKWSATESVISFDLEPDDDCGYSSGIRYYTLTPDCLTMYYGDGDFDGNYFKQ